MTKNLMNHRYKPQGELDSVGISIHAQSKGNGDSIEKKEALNLNNQNPHGEQAM